MTLVCRFCANMALLPLFDVIINESTDNNIDVTLSQRQQDRWSSAEAAREGEKEMDCREDRKKPESKEREKRDGA